MKKAVAVFLSLYMLTGSLIPGNNFFELSSIPTLVKHFQYHRAYEDKGISFSSYLKKHYGNSGHRDSTLPSHKNSTLHHHGRTIPVDEIVNLTSSFPGLCFSFSSDYLSIPLTDYFPDDQFSSGVFHPPSFQA
ncbi:MAG: hypothetical protein NT126_10945 [Bacteroidetes bacterium]|nr:hypothetical protein [Bacteroidota bacterium]